MTNSTPPEPGAVQQVKRYDLITNYRCGSAIEEMEPSDDGEWVRYDDVLAVLSVPSGGQVFPAGLATQFTPKRACEGAQPTAENRCPHSQCGALMSDGDEVFQRCLSAPSPAQPCLHLATECCPGCLQREEPAPAQEQTEQLSGAEIRKGTGDVLKDLAYARVCRVRLAGIKDVR